MASTTYSTWTWEYLTIHLQSEDQLLAMFTSLQNRKMVTQCTNQIASHDGFTTNTKEVDLTADQKVNNTTAMPSVQSAGCSVLLHVEAYCPVSVFLVTKVESVVFFI
jgi:hypothetical protein